MMIRQFINGFIYFISGCVFTVNYEAIYGLDGDYEAAKWKLWAAGIMAVFLLGYNLMCSIAND
jgi:hypothetical protein